MAYAVACLATASSALLGAAALLAGSHWPGELVCHFREQYAWLAACGLALAIAARANWAALAAALVLAWQFAGIAPFYLPATQPPAAEGPPLRIMALNVHTSNRLHARTISAIRRAKPDVVFLLEVNDRWSEALRALADEYPYSLVEPREHNFGMAVLSRRPWASAQVVYAIDEDFPFLIVELDHQERRWTIVGAHPIPPVRRSTWRLRNRQLEFLAAQVPSDRPVVVMGDLNLTSWSPEFGRLLASAQMRDSRDGFGLQPTWPAPLPFARIPIDHALVSPEVVVVGRRVGPDVGSDHLPVVVDIKAATRTPPGASR